MRHAKPRGHALVLATCLFAVAVRAEDGASSAPEDAYFGELPVVLAGSRLPQRIDAAPVAVAVIDRAMIEASGAREIEDLLRLAPGMIVGHHDGSRAFATYHAFADRFARRMQVLLDGRSVYSPALGGVDWSALPITVDDIERIEVVRGPNAAAYGANAFLGTISITTRRGAGDRAVTASTRKGQDAIDDTRLTTEHRADRWALRMTAANQADHGFIPLNRWLDSERTTLFNARLDLDLGAGDALLIEGGLSDGWRSDGRPGRRPDPPHDRFVSSGYLNLRWSESLSPDSEVAIAVFDAQDDETERYDTLVLGGGSGPLAGKVGAIDYSSESHRRDVELQHTLRVDESLRVVWGASARQDRVYSPGWLGSDEERSNILYRGFGHAEWQASPTWLLNAGVMYEETRITDPGWSPRLTATWSPVPGQSVRFGVSTATRTPVIFEQFADQAFLYQPGNVLNQYLLSTNTLEPETIRSSEVAWLGSFPAAHLRADVRAFHDEIDDLITYYTRAYADVDGIVQDFANTDRAELTGGEFQLDWRPGDRFALLLNGSYTHAVTSDVAERYGTATPHWVASLLARQRFAAGVDASIGVYYRSTFHGMDSLDRVPDHGRIDLRFGMPIGPWAERVRLDIVLQGAEGRSLDARNDMAFGPRLFGELTIEL